MKQATAEAIMTAFAKWAEKNPEIRPVCRPCCDACCTRNVTATAMEAERILQFIIDNNRNEAFAATLGATLAEQPAVSGPATTGNEFAAACLNEQEVPDDPEPSNDACPFLADGRCTIYEVRPFTCRLFVSSVICSSRQPAVVPDFYFEAATAASQLLEHLGQREYWGNLYDVLGSLLDLREYRAIAEPLEREFPGEPRKAQMRVKAAQPLPGFLISEENSTRVQQMLDTIFTTEVKGRTVEELLNGG